MKIAVITGASSGLGKEFAIQVSKQFSMVDEIWVIARRKDKLEELRKSIHNKKIVVIPLDFTLDESFQKYKQLLLERSPRIKIIINCSGYGKIGDLAKGDYDEQVNMSDVNSKAVIAMTKLSIPYMYSGSYIVNIASVAAFVPIPRMAVYSATKSMVMSFSRALAVELKSKGISVTAVCPGPIDTDFFNVAKSEQSLTVVDSVPRAKAYQLVKKALKDVKRKYEISIYGFPYKVFYLLSKIMPYNILVKMLYTK